MPKNTGIWERLLLITIVTFFLIQAVPCSVATTVTVETLANGNTQAVIDFSDAGFNTDNSMSVPFDANVTNATFVMGSEPHSAGGKDYPTNVKLDVGGDGDIEWAFNGTGYGAMGHQTMFSNEATSLGITVPDWAKSSMSNIRMPLNANITSATLKVNGSAGYDVWTEMQYDRNVMTEESGNSVAGLGDVNGDGYDDIGVGGRGRILIYFGGLGGINATPDINVSTSGFDFGILENVGDVNGDGLSDFYYTGKVYYGGSFINSSGDVTLISAGKGMGFVSVSYAGDLNKDGMADIIVGDSGSGMGYYGGAYVYYGGSPMNGVPDIIFDNPTATKGDGYGDSVTFAGDLNKDGWTDLAVGADYAGASDEGAVFIYYGSATWDNTSDLVLYGDLDGGAWPKFGSDVAGGKDLNRDGFDDLVVSAQENDVNAQDAGKVYVYYGGSPMDTNEDLEMFGNATWMRFGTKISLSRDLDGDGAPDLLVGHSTSSSAPGLAVFKGGASMDNVTDWYKNMTHTNNYFAKDFADAGNITLMGKSSLVVGAPNDMINRYGRFYLFNLFDMTAANQTLHLGGQVIWNTNGRIDGDVTTADFSSKLNTILDASLPSATDSYGNKYFDVQVNLTCVKGTLNVSNLDITYSYNASVPDFSDELTERLAGASGPDNVSVPLHVSTSTAGKVLIKGIKVDYIANGRPVAIIDGITPRPGVLGQAVSFNGHGTDTDGKIVSYRWMSDKMGVLETMQNPVLVNLSLGLHNITFEVKDNKGRWSEAAHDSIEIVPPNAIPVVTISRPTNNTKVAGDINISGNAQDINLDPLTVFVAIDSGTWLDASGNATWFYLWNTSSVADGEHTISARAWDTKDNSSIVSVKVNVDNSVIGKQEVNFSLTAPAGTYAKPGDKVSYNFSIANIGNIADTYKFKAETDNKWSVVLSTSGASLDPSGSAGIMVTVTIPSTAKDGVETLRFTATSSIISLAMTADVATVISSTPVTAGVEVEAMGDQIGIPGNTVDLVFKVKNVGTIPDDIAVQSFTSHGWVLAIPDVATLVINDLGMNETKDVKVTVTVPGDVVGPWEESVTFKAISFVDFKKMASASALVVIGAFDVDVTGPIAVNRTAKAGENVTYEFTVSNTGELNGLFEVSAVSSNGWVVNISKTEIELAAGSSAVVSVTLQVPADAKGGTIDDLTLTVVSRLDHSKIVTSKVTTTIDEVSKPKKEKGLIPGYTTTMTMATLSIGALLIFFRARRRD